MHTIFFDKTKREQGSPLLRTLVATFVVLLIPHLSYAGDSCVERLMNNVAAARNHCEGAFHCWPPGGGPSWQTGTFTSGSAYVNQNGHLAIDGLCSHVSCNGSPAWSHDMPSAVYCSASELPDFKNDKTLVRDLTCKKGSILKVENRAIGESVKLVGSSFSMNYFSHWSVGKKDLYKSVIKLPDLNTAVVSYDIDVILDGLSIFTQSRPNLGPESFSFQWDGLDNFGNSVIGSKKLELNIKQNLASSNLMFQKIIILGSFKATALGLGGWLPNVYKFYDKNSGTLFSGTGDVRKVLTQPWGTSGYMIADEDGRAVHLFNSDGRIAFTKSGLVGATQLEFVYDSNGRLISILEPFSRTTSLVRDGSGNFVSITAANGQVTSIELDSNGYLKKMTNPNSEAYEMTYTSDGLMQTFKKPGLQISTFSYDSSGSLEADTHSGGFFWDLVDSSTGPSNLNTQVITPLGRTDRYTGSRAPTSSSTNTQRADGSTSSFSRNEYGTTVVESYTDRGDTTNRHFQPDIRFSNSKNRETARYITAGSIYYQINYSQSLTLTDPNDPFSIQTLQLTESKGSRVITSVFDPLTKTWSSSSSLGKTVSVELDAYERAVSMQQGSILPLEISYTDERLSAVSHGTRLTQFSYDPTTKYLTGITNPLGQVEGFVYDSAGRVTAKVLPDARSILFSYDANGNVTNLTTPKGNAHVFQFNAHELLGAYQPPVLTGTVDTTYTYNLDKQITNITKPSGDYVSFNYNATSGFLDSYVTSEGTFSLDKNLPSGLPSQIMQPGGRRTIISYIGTKTEKVVVRDSSYNIMVSYTPTYSGSTGLLSSDKAEGPLENSVISYLYNNDEDLIKVGDLDITYNTPNGQLTGTTLGSGATVFTDSYTYNNLGEVTSYQVMYGATILYDLALGRDAMGRINGKTQSMNSTTDAFAYTFDNTGRLTETEKNSATVATYSYDTNSNRNGGTVGSTPTTATYDDQDRLLTYNTLSFTYNANGDLTSKTNHTLSQTTQYVYDVLGNLRTVTLPSTTVIEYEVDGLNRRIGKKVNGVLQKRWVYMDQYRIAAELDATGAIAKRFVYGSKGNIPDYMIASGENYRIISDHLGSPRLVVKQSDGSIIQRMNHDEFGRVTEDTNPGYLPFGFAGGLYDSQTGLVRFGARDFDSEIGRWTSKDPILFNGQDANLYGYVFNDPVNFVDPSGLVFQDIIADRYSPNVQLAIGSGLAALGAFTIRTGYQMSVANPGLGLAAIGLGVFLGYEGGKNINMARTRGAPEVSIPGLTQNPNQNQCSSLAGR
ncbi:tRNA(Glu)-specific nuclease WapA precursor [compost metagenome]